MSLKTEIGVEIKKEGIFNLNGQLIPLLSLFLITFLVYSKVINFSLLEYDDSLHFTKNFHLTQFTREGFLSFWQTTYFDLYIPVSYNLWSLEACCLDFRTKGFIFRIFFSTLSFILHLVAFGAKAPFLFHFPRFLDIGPSFKTYFRLGNPAGLVEHEEPQHFSHTFWISMGPLIINSGIPLYFIPLTLFMALSGYGIN